MAHLRIPRLDRPRPDLRYVRAPNPLHFPVSEEMPESKLHLVVRTFLFRILRAALAPAHSVGSEQFVYWNPANPKRSLAPDAFVCLDVPDSPFKTWKTWEQRGVPDLAVEIASEYEGLLWEEKLARYHELGVKELVRFDPSAPDGERLRVWDLVGDDLVERVIANDKTPCLTLGLNWLVCPIEDQPVGLRLVDDEGKLLDAPEEAAQRRVAELEAELRRLRGGA